jgi:hypothetical protein
MASRGTYTAKIVSVVSLLHDFSTWCLGESGPRERGPRGTRERHELQRTMGRNGNPILVFRPHRPFKETQAARRCCASRQIFSGVAGMST